MWTRLLFLLLFSSLSFADSNIPKYNVIQISASSTGEINNDTVVVKVIARAEELSAATASKKVNSDMQWALKLLKKYPKVKSQTQSYHTYPRYRDQRISSWEVEQELRLETENIEEMAKLTSKLQERLLVQNMQYDVSPNNRRTVENELIADVIKAFKKRADVVTDSLGFDNYKIVNLQIHTDSNRMPAPRMEMMRMEKTMASEPAAMQAGTQKVNIRADGQIELIN